MYTLVPPEGELDDDKSQHFAQYKVAVTTTVHNVGRCLKWAVDRKIMGKFIVCESKENLFLVSA